MDIHFGRRLILPETQVPAVLAAQRCFDLIPELAQIELAVQHLVLASGQTHYVTEQVNFWTADGDGELRDITQTHHHLGSDQTTATFDFLYQFRSVAEIVASTENMIGQSTLYFNQSGYMSLIRDADALQSALDNYGHFSATARERTRMSRADVAPHLHPVFPRSASAHQQMSWHRYVWEDFPEFDPVVIAAQQENSH